MTGADGLVGVRLCKKLLEFRKIFSAIATYNSFDNIGVVIRDR